MALSIGSSRAGDRGARYERGVAAPCRLVRERRSASVEIDPAPELGQEQRPEPIDALAPIGLAELTLAQLGDVPRLEEAACGDGAGREQVVGHDVEHVAESEVVLQAVEALADGERLRRQQAGARFA